MAGLVFILVLCLSGCWRALAKGTAWAFFFKKVKFIIIIILSAQQLKLIKFCGSKPKFR